MDVTQLFKACVKTVRFKKKLSVASISPDNNNKTVIATKPTKPNNENIFYVKSKHIAHQITQLRDFLIENRAAYMKFACHLKRSAQMTDEERDIIDSESEKIIRICSDMIFELNILVKKQKCNKQLEEHLNGIVEMLSGYLKSVNKIYTDQKQYRVQRDIESLKFLKLDSNKKKPTRSIYDETSPPLRNNAGDNFMNDRTKTENRNTNGEVEMYESTDGLRNRKQNKLSLDDEITNNELTYSIDGDHELTAEDIQMFESENVQLFGELKGLSEDVEQIEKNVVGIAKLQEIFTEKVTFQKQDIDRIANTVVGATENVHDANEQIKQAIQRNAGLRVYILFFLIVMSFSLLFLDWYND